MEIKRSLSDIVDFVKEKNYDKFDEFIDETAGIIITAGTILSVLIYSINPITAITTATGIGAVKPSKFFKWMSDKFNFINKDRDSVAKEHYDKLALANLMLVHLAARASYEEILLPELQKLRNDVSVDDKTKKKLEEYANEESKKIFDIRVELPRPGDFSAIKMYIEKVIEPIEYIVKMCIEKSSLDCLESYQTIINSLINRTFTYYNAFLINLVTEFPEISLWVNIDIKQDIMKLHQSTLNEIRSLNEEQSDIKKLIEHQEEVFKQFEKNLNQVESFRKYDFKEEFGFTKSVREYEELISRHIDNIKSIFSKEKLENLKSHHTRLKSYLKEPILKNEDLKDIEYPTNEDIYIPQSYKILRYRKGDHEKKILDPRYWEAMQCGAKVGEDIAQQLMISLLDPYNSFNPIVILGHPGAGKSMLSNIFAARLCDSKDYVPFFIKLKEVDSSNTEIGDHINEGLRKSLLNNADVNWLSWAREFPDRIPVIILDGFDELLQASPTGLNGYLIRIQELQERAYEEGISIRVIISSRLTIMQDVKIPDNTTIIKLDSFDEKRQKLWINKWNSIQTKIEFVKFNIPKNKHILELAKEPLLLFMLAVYDFEKSDLQKAANDTNFNQSKLYDQLFTEFSYRQLQKGDNFKDLESEEAEEEKKLFRLRLGLVALMMFLNDKTSYNSSDLDKDIEEFGLQDDDIDAKKIFNGFFFIHENKATDEQGQKYFNFEFLHKTFGEFLAADFLLRVALANANEDRVGKLYKLGTFRFCFGYNWLHKHSKIVSFLFEHAQFTIKEDIRLVEKNIKKELELIFSSSSLNFPANEVNVGRPKPLSIIEHLAVYSQNLILLWSAVCAKDNEIIFKLPEFEGKKIKDKNFNITEKKDDEKDSILYQDYDEFDANKLAWKRLTKLWELVGNCYATAKLNEWITVNGDNEAINLVIKNKRAIQMSSGTGEKNYFHSASKVSCNDYELLLSYFTIDFTLRDISTIIRRKPQFSALALDLIYNRFDTLVDMEGKDLLYWLKETFSNYQLEQHRIIFKLIRQFKYNDFNLSESMLADSYIWETLPSREKLDFLEFSIQNGNRRTTDMLIKRFIDIPFRGNGILFEEKLNFIELVMRNYPKSNIVDKVMYEFKEEIYKLREVHPKYRMKYIELIGKYAKDEHIIERALFDIYDDTRGYKSLSFNDCMKFIELLHKYAREKNLIKNVFDQLIDNADHSYKLQSKDRMKLIETIIKYYPGDYDKNRVLENVVFYNNFIQRASIKEQLKVAELVNEYMGDSRLAEYIVKDIEQTRSLSELTISERKIISRII